ncbi:MAG: protein translocase subunit SecD [Thermodesulfobacteriota bacterium]|nr:protein translocase subunit SecD [Thermodesulfobacteriota bacterium]
MDRFKIRGLLILIVFLVGLLYALPTFVGEGNMPDGWIGPKTPVKKGLDLQGGMHLVLKVETIKAVEGRMGNIISGLKDEMVKKRIHYRQVDLDGSDGIRVVLRQAQDMEKLEDLVGGDYPFLVKTDTKNKDTVLFRMTPDEVVKIRDAAVSQALETIRNRVDEFGVSEPVIIPEGKERILLQLPGVTDPERAKDLIGKTAVLKFKLVDEEHSIGDALAGDVPLGSYIAYTKDGYREVLLKKRTVLTGNLLDDARMSISSGSSASYVSLTFSREGGRIFERITRDNVGKRLAILLDGKVYSSPVIREAISGGRAIIEGRFTDTEASDLAIVLRAGALPAPVNIMEERTVGPSLGRDSIRKGFLSILLGGVIVIVFMVIYYRLSGLLADLALVVNIILILGVLSMFHAVLTLPGIAGIVLTIGMAVDANAIIYERIKEEIRLGRSAKMAIESGYKNALSTILDANITTLIAALVLFQFGTGPIRGFAVTLTVGIVSSLFTALLLCRWIMEWFVFSKKIERISI